MDRPCFFLPTDLFASFAIEGPDSIVIETHISWNISDANASVVLVEGSLPTSDAATQVAIAEITQTDPEPPATTADPDPSSDNTALSLGAPDPSPWPASVFDEPCSGCRVLSGISPTTTSSPGWMSLNTSSIVQSVPTLTPSLSIFSGQGTTDVVPIELLGLTAISMVWQVIVGLIPN